MKLDLNNSPREFTVGKVSIHDHGNIHLEPSDMITLVTSELNRCDITATEWGYYLGSSINERLVAEGFKVALVKNSQNKFFINAVIKNKLELFKQYLIDNQDSEIVCWLDETDYLTIT